MTKDSADKPRPIETPEPPAGKPQDPQREPTRPAEPPQREPGTPKPVEAPTDPDTEKKEKIITEPN
ncbi:MAG: hypothetical protein KF767_09970 [Bdellovibrionaceae bacterium]|nr:hypothetical protein [Pseudobdellovibrionaceae bacterium]